MSFLCTFYRANQMPTLTLSQAVKVWLKLSWELNWMENWGEKQRV